MVYRRLKRKPALSRNLLLKNIVIRHSASLSFYFSYNAWVLVHKNSARSSIERARQIDSVWRLS